MQDTIDKKDATWRLLKKAKPVEVEPLFARTTRNLAASTPQGAFSGLRGWLKRLPGRGDQSGWMNFERIAVSRYLLAGGTCALLAALLITVFSQRSPEAAPHLASTDTLPGELDQKSDLTLKQHVADLSEPARAQFFDTLSTDLEEIPEVAALEADFDGVGELIHLASVRDVESLGDDEIEMLLF